MLNWNKNLPYHHSTDDSKLVNFGFVSYKEFMEGGIMTKEEKEWKKSEDSIYKFESEGDTVFGKLISKEKGYTYDNEVYKIETDDKKVLVIFSTSVLQSLMANINIGQEVKIVYLGSKQSEKKGFNDIKLFEVFKNQVKLFTMPPHRGPLGKTR